MGTRILTLLFAATCISFLDGCGGDDSHPTYPLPLNVHGVIEDGYLQPLGHLTVIVGNQTSTTSESDGSFHISGVEAPYDVTIVSSTDNRAAVYRGLTRSDPKLMFLTVEPPEKGASFTGTVPAAPGKSTRVYFATDGFTKSVEANPTSGAYEVVLLWRLPIATLPGSLFVLRLTSGLGGRPAQYDGWANRDLVVSSGGNVGHQGFTNEDLLDPPELRLAGDVTAPSGYTVYCCGLGMALGRLWLPIDVPVGTPPIEFTVPGIPGSSFQMEVMARQAFADQYRETYLAKGGIQAPASDLVFEVPPAANLLQPAHLATSVGTSTSFLWSVEGEDGISVVVFVPLVDGDPEYVVYLDGATTGIPDLKRVGLGLPRNGVYAWAVARLFPVASMDEIATEEFWTTMQAEEGVSYSEARAFFTSSYSSLPAEPALMADEPGTERLELEANSRNRALGPSLRSLPGLGNVVRLERFVFPPARPRSPVGPG